MTTEQDVIALVAKKTGRPENSITPEKTFYQLGIDGDDAVELIAELCRRYQVPAEKVDLPQTIPRSKCNSASAISIIPKLARAAASGRCCIPLRMDSP